VTTAKSTPVEKVSTEGNKPTNPLPKLAEHTNGREQNRMDMGQRYPAVARTTPYSLFHLSQNSQKRRILKKQAGSSENMAFARSREKGAEKSGGTRPRQLKKT
jgi:hypothetical protein